LIDIAYILVCPLAYVLAGTTKFVLNTIREGRLAFEHVGLGGAPSTHTSIASAPVWLILIREGLTTPVLAVAMGFLMIVVIDAMDLRPKLGQVHSILKTRFAGDAETQGLRDRIGHSLSEVLCGVIVGGFSAFIITYIFYVN
jgi:uncharacterized protein